MATADNSGDEGGGDASACARDYVVDRLREADSPMSPAELATEYGCRNGHIRNILADILRDGAAERVDRGQYVAADADASLADSEVRPDMQAEMGESTEADTSDEGTDADAYPSADGEVPSEDTDTKVEDDREDRDGGRPELDDDDFAEVPTEAVGAAGAAGGTMILSGLSDGGLKTWHVVALLAVVGIGWYLLQSSSSGDGDDGAVEDDQEASVEQDGLAGFDATGLGA